MLVKYARSCYDNSHMHLTNGANERNLLDDDVTMTAVL